LKSSLPFDQFDQFDKAHGRQGSWQARLMAGKAHGRQAQGRRCVLFNIKGFKDSWGQGFQEKAKK